MRKHIMEVRISKVAEHCTESSHASEAVLLVQHSQNGHSVSTERRNNHQIPKKIVGRSKHSQPNASESFTVGCVHIKKNYKISSPTFIIMLYKAYLWP